MAKMNTIKHLAVGAVPLMGSDQARIERNLFAANGDTFEALRFCKYRNGRHNRVHLVISEADFVSLFGEAIRNQVFSEPTLAALLDLLTEQLGTGGAKIAAGHKNPFLDVVGIGEDGTLTQGIDEELYGEPKE